MTIDDATREVLRDVAETLDSYMIGKIPQSERTAELSRVLGAIYGVLRESGDVQSTNGEEPAAADVPIVTASADPSIADFLDPDGSMRDAGILSESDVPIVNLDDAITGYCEALTRTGHCADMETVRYDPDPRGKKYTRIVRTTTAKVSGEVTSQSVSAFVKREDGTIWKAAGWKAPALNFPRGSVYQADSYATHLNGYGL